MAGHGGRSNHAAGRVKQFWYGCREGLFETGSVTDMVRDRSRPPMKCRWIASHSVAWAKIPGLVEVRHFVHGPSDQAGVQGGSVPGARNMVPAIPRVDAAGARQSNGFCRGRDGCRCRGPGSPLDADRPQPGLGPRVGLPEALAPARATTPVHQRLSLSLARAPARAVTPFRFPLRDPVPGSPISCRWPCATA